MEAVVTRFNQVVGQQDEGNLGLWMDQKTLQLTPDKLGKREISIYLMILQFEASYF